MIRKNSKDAERVMDPSNTNTSAMFCVRESGVILHMSFTKLTISGIRGQNEGRKMLDTKTGF